MNNSIFQKFNSVTEFERYLTTTETQKEWAEYGYLSSQDGSESFTHTASYEEANKLLLFGDKELAEKINAGGYLANKLKIEQERKKRIFRSALVGHAPNVANYVAGVPNSMIRTENVPQKNRTIDILYSMNASSRIPTEEIINAGVNLLSAILMLRNDNVTVNLYMLDASFIKKHNSVVGAAIKIKDASQEIDVLNCAYAMCHPSFLRRHMFRWLEVTYPKYVSGYGLPVERAMTEEFMRENNVSGTLVLFSEICGLTKEEIIKKYFDKK